MSTPVGHSRLQPLHDTQRSSVSYISCDAKASSPGFTLSWPDSASRNVFARPRVKCCSSPVARYDGHMVPASNLRQWPLLLHISTALSKPPHSDQSSTVSIFLIAYSGLYRNSERSSILDGRTILPGFNSPFGSKIFLI